MIECRYCDTIVDTHLDYESHFEEFHSGGLFTHIKNASYVCHCDHCGDSFERSWGNIWKNQYCDPECQRKGRTQITGEQLEARKRFQKQRELARQRDGYRCQACGSPESEHSRELDVHHITPRSEFDKPIDAHDLDNLVTLCSGCHKEYEGKNARPLSVDPTTDLERGSVDSQGRITLGGEYAGRDSITVAVVDDPEADQ